MFDINNDVHIVEENVEGSSVYVIDNFYKDPEEVLNIIFSVDPKVWKDDEVPSFNQVFFDDRRHFFKFSEIKKVYNFLGDLCKQKPLVHGNADETAILTNLNRFKKCSFNDYENNYWWPHKDVGYNGIIYLNPDERCGTNLYENLNPEEEPPDYSEHYRPWRNKKNFKLIKTIEPKYNRMVLFDGLKFTHGMNICNDDYFGETYRINQIFFFEALDNEDQNPYNR
mgnify:CR=1 FL=1